MLKDVFSWIHSMCFKTCFMFNMKSDFEVLGIPKILVLFIYRRKNINALLL